MRLISSSRRHTLSSLTAGARGIVHEVRRAAGIETDRLTALGVTSGARVIVLQTFPGIVFCCDQTELAVERSVAATILIELADE